MIDAVRVESKPVLMQLKPGEIFDDYRVLRALKSGGMGVIYLARQISVPREVVLKVAARFLDPAKAKADSNEYHEISTFIARFKRELEIIQRLRHENIVRLLGGDISKGVAWMALDYVDGEDLEERLKKPLGVEDGLKIFRRVAAALDYAHDERVIHRDIKPSNILLSRNGEAYLADFGISTLTDGALTKLTASNFVVGTSDYLAPEQAVKGRSQTKSIDIYALSIVCYRWLVGKVPFEGVPLEIMRQHVHNDFPASELRRLAPDVGRVLKYGAAKAAKDRYESASALIDDLTRALRGESILGPWRGAPNVETARPIESPQGFPTPLLRNSKRRWLAAALAIAIVGLAGVLAAVYGPLSGRNDISRTPAASIDDTPASPIATTRNPTSSRTTSVDLPIVETRDTASDSNAKDTAPAMKASVPAASGNARSPAEEAALAYQDALRFANWRGDKQNTEKMLAQLRKAADLGLARAQFTLGLLYELGDGVDVDPAQAVAWYRKAADQGFAKAQNNLANAYRTGRGIDADAAAAAGWYRKAADAGNPTAQFNLGTMLFFMDQGISMDMPAAVKWFQKSADQGNSRAQFELSIAYANGLGIQHDSEKSASWSKKAADQGYSPRPNFGGNVEANNAELDLYLSLRAAPMIER